MQTDILKILRKSDGETEWTRIRIKVHDQTEIWTNIYDIYLRHW